MNKKFLLTLLAILCALCCTIGLAACGGDGDGNGGGIYIVRASDGVDLGSNPNLGEFAYMSNGDDFAAVFDFKVCTKTADGALVDVDPADTTVIYKYGGVEIMNPVPTSYSDFKVGYYTIDIEYNGFNAIASFYVNKSTKAYSATVNKTNWKYGEEGATLSVYDATQFSAYVISEADYNAINALDGNEKKEALFNKRNSYDPEHYDVAGMTPGKYYLFAECAETDNYVIANSDFKQVTVLPGDVTIKDTVNITTDSYTYGQSSEATGDIKLSEISIQSSGSCAIDGFGKEVYGEFVWQNPNTSVNSTKSGQEYALKFVPDDNVCYNEKNDAYTAEITVNKGYVRMPDDVDDNRVLDSGYDRYTGKAFKVYAGSGSDDYDKYINVKLGNVDKTITEENGYCILDSVTEIGEYNYTLSLKDKTNFYWIKYGEGFNDIDENNNADWTLSYTIKGMQSHVQFYNKCPQLVPDNTGKIRIAVAPFATPYVAGTLTAQLSEHNSVFTATVAVEYDENENADYLVISNITNKDGSPAYGVGAYMNIKFSGTGKDNYDNIENYEADCPIQTYVEKPMYNDNYYAFIGTPAGAIYEKYPKLRTTAGDYKLYMRLSSDGDYTYAVGDSATIEDPGVYYFKYVLDTSKIDANTVCVFDEEFTFTITFVEFDFPIAAGTQIDAAVGTSLQSVLDQYLDTDKMQNSYGEWFVSYYDANNGGWYPIVEGSLVTEGETKYVVNFNGTGDPFITEPAVEFTIIGA